MFGRRDKTNIIVNNSEIKIKLENSMYLKLHIFFVNERIQSVNLTLIRSNKQRWSEKFCHNYAFKTTRVVGIVTYCRTDSAGFSPTSIPIASADDSVRNFNVSEATLIMGIFLNDPSSTAYIFTTGEPYDLRQIG